MQLWEHQQEAIAFCLARLEAPHARVLVQLPPGTGKTEVAARVAIEWVKRGPFRRVLIAVPTAPIMRQYYARLVALTNITVAIEKASNTKFTYIPYRGGGEVAVQLVGKHIDSTVNNPIEAVAQWRGGAGPNRCAGFR